MERIITVLGTTDMIAMAERGQTQPNLAADPRADRLKSYLCPREQQSPGRRRAEGGENGQRRGERQQRERAE